MSEIGAIRNAFRMERQAAKVEKAAAKTTANVTATGKVVDISKGFNVKGPDGTVIPFRPETPLSKAREWVKNFYRKESDFDIKETMKLQLDDAPGADWTQTEEWSIIRDKTDRGNFLQFAEAEDGRMMIKMSYASAKSKGKGIGAGMYRVLFEKAKAKGSVVESDTKMSPDSIAIWRRFKSLGYPIKENKIVKDTRMPGKEWYAAEDGGPLFEYDPTTTGIKKQAGQVPGDTTETTGMLVKPQAGEARPNNMTKVEPGLYFDEDSSSYVRVGDDGSISKVELDEAS